MSARESLLAGILAPVAQDLERMRQVVTDELRSDSAAVADMTDHISRFRGKQLRGALLLLMGRAVGSEEAELPTVAAIVELIHLATLVHDDVLDGARVRRRVASVNERWDNQVAVLLGDWLYARAFDLSTRLESRLCSQVLSRTTQVICAGEIDQASGRYDFEASQERYEAIAGAKTAALYAAACDLGARYRARAPEDPGPLEERAASMERFGWELGLAFQIVDDCLDLTGTEAEVGKSVGNDVDDGKVTLPVLHAYRSADEATRSRIRDVYTLPGLDGRAERLRAICDLEKGIAHAQERADELLASARARLDTLPDSPARAALAGITDFVKQREW